MYFFKKSKFVLSILAISIFFIFLFFQNCGSSSSGKATSDVVGTVDSGAAGSSPDDIGEDSTLPPKEPVIKTGLTGVAVGENHQCVIVSGEVKCWGRNLLGAVGNGEQRDYATTAQVIKSDAVDIAAGENFSCSVRSSGSLSCWGDNSFGAVTGEFDGRVYSSPVELISSGVTQVSGYKHWGCALVNTAVQCWGGMSDYSPLVGIGLEPRKIWTIIPSGATQVSVGGYHACAILKGGEVKCWGQNMMGQLGSRAAGNVLLPPDVAIERGATFVSSGHVHTCAVVAEALYCWGQNMWGQLGTGSNMPYMITTPTKVISSGVKMVAAGLAHTCVLMKTGSVQCWGRNEFGQVGDGSIETAYSPKGTSIKGDATSISVNNYTSCAIVLNKLKCWGRENQNFEVVNAPKDEAL
ncbi:MAG: hypothetical protein HUU56_10285 [Bdellovibrionaceae bacterium]|nr:hypothetical protein [Pseudobdellovibrionaceae bacterium]